MNLIKLITFLSVTAMLANAAPSKNIGKEITSNFDMYVKLQNYCFEDFGEIRSMQKAGFSFPSSSVIEYGEMDNLKGIYAIAKNAQGSCPKGGKWEIIPFVENSGKTLKYKCSIDAGCESLTPKIKSICEIDSKSVKVVAKETPSAADMEKAKEINMSFGVYVKLQDAFFMESEKIGFTQDIGFSFPKGGVIEYGETKSPKGIYAVAKQKMGSCLPGSKWELVPYTEKNGKVLKYRCNIDAGCESLTPYMKALCVGSTSLEKEDEVKVQKGSMTDPRDGKKYKTITIEFNGESKTWMAENLNYNTSGSTCLLEKKAKCQKYGRLYSFDAAKNACPTGWHLSSLMDWIKLLSAVGWNGEWGEKFKVSGIGKKLKSKTGWEKNTNGTDEFGFSVLPGSFIHETKHFDEGFVGVFWYDDEKVRGFFSIYSENDEVQMWRGVNSQKSSVRCVKD